MGDHEYINIKILNKDDEIKNSKINKIISNEDIDNNHENNKILDEKESVDNYYKKENYLEDYDLAKRENCKNTKIHEEVIDKYNMYYDNNLNKELLSDSNIKKKKYIYENLIKNKNNNSITAEFEEIPYSSFNNFESENVENMEKLNNNGINLFNYEKLNKIERKKKKYNEKNRKKKNYVDDKKFSEVYNSIYENLKKKKKETKKNGEDNYSNKNEIYDINYSSSVNVNSISSIEDDYLFNEDILKKYIIGQVLNIIRTSFHWAIISFFLIFLFHHFSIFYVYRLISFIVLLFFTPISIYLVKKKSIKLFLILTNVIRFLIWGIFIPLLYYLYKNQIKKYYINGVYELIFIFLLIIDNIQINISNLIDIDNNGIDFLSKKYHLKINEKAKRKFFTLHQFFFDTSFIIINPLIVFLMYLFSKFYNEEDYQSVFIYSSSFIFSIITIITILIYSLGLKKNKVITGNNNYNNNDQNNSPLHNIRENVDNISNDISYNNENDFEKYYEQKIINDKYINHNNYSDEFNNQKKKNSKEKENVLYDNYMNEEISLKNQFKKQFFELLNNCSIVKKKKKIIFYIMMLSYLNSVEDIMVLMLIPFTSIYISELYYIPSMFIQILISVILISLTKCFENIYYYSNKKNIIALRDILIGIILLGISLLLYFFPFLMINHLNIYTFLILYIICCIIYFFISTNLKTE